MFSYRHAFHAGNHADVLKHMVLIAVLRHLRQKDTALTVFDTHAGAGLYRLDGDYAQTSGEAAHGYLRLVSAANEMQAPVNHASTAIKSVANSDLPGTLAPMIADYLDLAAGFNGTASYKIYPGSPFIIQRLLGERDKLKLFELHPTDARTLVSNLAQLPVARQVLVLREDGFEGLKKFLPPPSRRALVLSDPSYELKEDYTRVSVMLADALQRFATGCYLVWHPVIPRPQAHELPRKLKALAARAGKRWLHATLSVKSSKLKTDPAGKMVRPGLPASGVFIVNPPHTLDVALKLALPQLVRLLGQNQHAAFSLESAK